MIIRYNVYLSVTKDVSCDSEVCLLLSCQLCPHRQPQIDTSKLTHMYDRAAADIQVQP